MKRTVLLLVLVLLPVGVDSRAGADLKLTDGTMLSGVTVERTRDGCYLLTKEDGTVVTVPVELVKKLQLSADEDPAPSALREWSSAIVGPELEPPKTRDQLASFGRPPAPFQPGVVRTDWAPTNALGPDVANFNPVRWFKAPVSVDWIPTPAYRASMDVTQFNPVRWFKGPVATSWQPTSGFRPGTGTEWFTIESPH